MEQVPDKVVTDHNLLQSIAHVNRIGDEHKDKGRVVDYIGIGHHSKRACDAQMCGCRN
jgi:type I restriction enzyme, R subunit